MLVKTAFAFVVAAVVGRTVAKDAAPVKDNPVGIVYKAALPDKPFFSAAAVGGDFKGSVVAIAPLDGNGVKFNVRFDGLPADGGPFTYHLHAEPAPDGNCTATLAHLDSVGRGSDPACDASAPASCEVGDLSGKHGKVDTMPFHAQYVDHYASTKEGDAAFFGNRSFVLHYANGTRLACANFDKTGAPATSSFPSGNCSTPNNPPETGTGGAVPTETSFTGGSAALALSLPLGLVVAFAVFVGLG